MAKRALLVGINYPGTKAELQGCVNDVWNMHRALVGNFGFSEDNIRVLIDTDDRYLQPTGANIRRALTDLISGARPGDILFFHYSGHGTRVPADADENDETGYDECIVPCDMNLIHGNKNRKISNKHNNTNLISRESCLAWPAKCELLNLCQEIGDPG
jgi:uncharacterized caspase-like protein